MPFGGALAVGAIGAGTSLIGGVLGGKAAKSPAETQAKASDKIGADAKAAAATAAGDVNTATQQANEGITQSNQGLTDAQAQQLAALKPYIDAGTVSLGQLQSLLSDTGSLATDKFKFGPEDYQNDPGYDYQKQQAQLALQRTAAAGGGLFTGGTVRATERLATNLADTHLNDAFTRALNTYQANRQSTLDRIAGYQGLLGLGFNATTSGNKDIGDTAFGINANNNRIAQNVIGAGEYSGNTGLRASEIAGNALAGKANAEAAGDIGFGNSWNAALGGIANSTLRAYQISKYPKQGPGPLVTGNTYAGGNSYDASGGQGGG